MPHPFHRRRKVLRNGLPIRLAVRQKIDLRIIHLFRKTLQQAAEEFAELQRISRIAQRVANRRPLTEIVVSGTKPVDGIAKKAQVEEDVPTRGRNRIVNLMAGQRLDGWMRIQIREDIALLDAAVAVGCIQPRESIAKVAVEDILNRGARVFQDVIVQNNEAQRDVLRDAF